MTASRRAMVRRSAFTLIEMLVVLVLSAIMAGIVTVSLAGSHGAARAEDAAGRIATYDRLSREYFRKFGRSGRLVLDLGRNTVTRVSGDPVKETNSRDAVGAALHLPSEFRLGQVVTADGVATSGQVSIRCSAEGQTASYALGLSDGRGMKYWVVTAGLTGHTVRVRDEQEVRDIFRAISDETVRPASGDDAR